jgi:hypothetical protein
MGLKLGDISPLAGIMTGKGAIGELADKGLLGIAPRMIASKAQEKDEAKDLASMAQAKEAETMQKQKMMEVKSKRSRPQKTGMEGGYKGYAKGGKVSSASKRADGCAIKGKTKGRMV